MSAPEALADKSSTSDMSATGVTSDMTDTWLEAG